MKNLIVMLICLASLSISGQNSKTEFDGTKWNPPYHLTIPKGWDVERFLIPMAFVPQISYRGVEDIRFTPGWGDAKSDEYWTYAFLWYIDGSPKTNEKIIRKNLRVYYKGLIITNVEKRKIPAKKIIPVRTSVKKVETEKGDVNTYAGTIDMLDYMGQKPIMLNCIVHLKSCSGQNKTFIFYEISPKPLTDPVWQRLHKLWKDFDCNKK
jgi:hypothetical protein